jgi:hypothetical protein
MSKEAFAQTVTLYAVSQDALPGETVIEVEDFSISAAGTNSDGETTYVEVDEITSLLLVQASATLTIVSAPTTFTSGPFRLQQRDPH